MSVSAMCEELIVVVKDCLAELAVGMASKACMFRCVRGIAFFGMDGETVRRK